MVPVMAIGTIGTNRIEDCGTKWFATKAEAEKRLEEIRNKNEN